MIFSKIIKDDLSLLNLIKAFNNKNENLLLTYFNQHCYNIYMTNKKYKESIHNYFQIYIDGIGIFSAMKILNFKNVKLINASDLNTKIIEYLIVTKRKVVIIGGSFSKSQILKVIEEGLNVILYKNGFYKDNEIPKIISEITMKNTDIIIIGMGVPRQELFAIKLNENLKGKIIICVGNFIEFYLGTIKRAPKLFRILGMEWCYRIYTEPRRLWERYIYGIPIFIKSIITLKVKTKLSVNKNNFS